MAHFSQAVLLQRLHVVRASHLVDEHAMHGSCESSIDGLDTTVRHNFKRGDTRARARIWTASCPYVAYRRQIAGIKGEYSRKLL